ncbi:MAG: zinc ribbon domain-containing protein, partial [Clostridia bacterium]|nr:zinc ribbon domain-containing protein [Clostridia bacterium]
KNRQNKCNHPNLLTGKMYCAHCGKLYYRKDSKDRKGNTLSRWICSGKINNGADSCPSFTIYEEEIKEIIYEVFRDTSEDARLIIEEYTKLFTDMTAKDTTSVDIQKLKDRLELLSKKKSKLLEYNIAGQISDRDFVEMNKQISEESAEIYSNIEEMENEINSRAGFKEKIEGIRQILQKAENDASKEMIDSAFVNKYVDKIYVNPVDDGVVEVIIKIFSGDTFGKTFEKIGTHLAGRTGHTFKKMIESYENSMK